MCERPKIVVAAETADAHQQPPVLRPGRRNGGLWANQMATSKAPMAGAARNQPKPAAPTSRILVA